MGGLIEYSMERVRFVRNIHSTLSALLTFITVPPTYQPPNIIDGIYTGVLLLHLAS